MSTTRRYTHVDVEITRGAITDLDSMFETTREKRKAEEEKRRVAEQQILLLQPIR